MADKRISQLVDRGTVANNDVVPIVVSGATTTNKATISSIQTFMQGNLDLGVTSVGITLGSSGTDVSVSGSPITSSGNITINLPTASATNRGLLSSADWTTFNSKQQAITLTTTGTSGAATLVSGTLNIPNYSTDLSGYVTLGTTQTITAQKTFTTSGSSDTMIISHGSGSGFALDVLKAGNGEAIRVTKSSGSGNAMTISGGNFEAGTIVKTGGTSSQFLKADGSVDSSTYLTTASAGTTYVPYTGAGANVDLGIYNLTANAVNVNASGSNAGVINLESNTIFSLVNGYGTIGSGTTNQFNFYQTTGAGVFRGAILSLNSITASATRTYTLPDADGTLALTTDLGAYLPLTGGTLSNNLFITGGGLQVSGSASANRQVVELYTSSTVSRLAASYVGSSSYGDLELLTGGLARLTISAAGVSTFSGALNGTTASFTGNVQGDFFTVGTTAATSGGIRLGTQVAIRARNVANTANIPLIESTASDGVSVSNGALILASTGAATFSGDVAVSKTGTYSQIQLIDNTASGSTWVTLSGFPALGDYTIREAGVANHLVIKKTSGNVGIGTNSPSAVLHVAKSDGANDIGAVIQQTANNTAAFLRIAANNDGGAAYNFITSNTNGGTEHWRISGEGASSTFAVRTGGTERMRITSVGNVGIGTASPSSRLEVSSSAFNVATFNSTFGQMAISFANNGTTFSQIGSGVSVCSTAAADDLGFGTAGLNKNIVFATGTGFTERLRITSVGNIGIGTASPNRLTEIVSSSGGVLGVSTSGSGSSILYGRIAMYSTAGSNSYIDYGGEIRSYSGAGIDYSDLRFYTAAGSASAERMRITSGGALLVGKTDPTVDTGDGLRVDSDGTLFACIANAESSYYVRDITNATYRFRVSGAGTVFATNTTISSISDERLKENVRDLDSGIDKIMLLKPRLFDWKDGSGQTGKDIRGFIAQEVEEHFPEFIDEWSTENLEEGEVPYKSVRMDIIPILVKAIQEQQTEIDSLKNQMQ